MSSGRPSSSIAPATRRTSKPSSPRAQAHLRASTATPSSPPRRNETTTASGATSVDDRARRPVDGAGSATLMYARRRFVASSTARATASASCCGRTIADPDTSCSDGGITNTTVTTATSCAPTRTICALSTSMHSAAGSSWRSASTVAVATSRWRARRGDRALGEADRLLVVAGERDAHERAQAVGLGGDRDDRRAGVGREHLRVEDVAAELHDRDDAAVELEPERRERDRLHVADDLLRVLARSGRRRGLR